MGYFGVFIFSLFMIGYFCSANDIKRLKARVKLLETRLNFQVSIRDEEYEEITERLDEIDKSLNFTVVRDQPVIPAMCEISNLDYKTVNLLKGDYARIRKAFREEKSETERIRREIPKIENSLVSTHEDIENYCTNTSNMTYKLLAGFELSSAFEEEMLKDLKGKLETVSKNTEDIMVAAKHESQNLKDLALKLEKVEIDTKRNIENIETLVTNLYSNINSWFLGSSCFDMMQTKSGIYHLQLGFNVYCDHAIDGGGWTVFQRRLNGDVDFYRNWTEYKNGFGDLSGEFWLGNDYLSILTGDGYRELRVEMNDFDGNSVYAKYSKFKIYPEEDKYKLEVSGYSGTAGDALTYHNGMMFSTFDSDNDKWPLNCADRFHGAWWYKGCDNANLNGQYYNEPGKKDMSGINWYTWKNNRYCLKSVEMKFR